MEVLRLEKGIVLCQRKYALELIKEAGLENSKPGGVPLEQHFKMTDDDDPGDDRLSDPSRYQRLIEKLIYLSLTCPDISYSV